MLNEYKIHVYTKLWNDNQWKLTHRSLRGPKLSRQEAVPCELVTCLCCLVATENNEQLL